jgi:hypothetical protein
MSGAVKGPWFVVAAGTPASECRSCHERVYWIVTAAGKRMPVDVDVEGGYAPDAGRVEHELDINGHGVSHFATCPFAAQHRGPR